MSMTNPYCDINADLQAVFKDIENFSGKETIETFTATSGQDKTFDKRNTGFCGAVYEDGVPLTIKTSIATVQATASTFWYDSTNDILYVHCSDDADPDTHTIQIALEDWATLKQRMADRAFHQLESMLDPKYPRPLPFAKESYEGELYDADITICAALLTCVNIIKHRDSSNPIVKKLMDQIWNANDEIGILWEYRQGLRAFSFEATKDSFDGNIKLLTRDASSTGIISVVGSGNRSARRVIRIEIVTGGAVGTATYKYSLDLETTWSSTYKTAINYCELINNIYLKFQETFVAGDKWELEILGDPEQEQTGSLTSIPLRRL